MNNFPLVDSARVIVFLTTVCMCTCYFLSTSSLHYFSFSVFPKKINFDLSDSIKRKIYFAETALGDQIVASDTHVLEFTDYGKRFITFNKLSPDSYVQMSMMLAYYKLYGKIVSAYEPVLTKALSRCTWLVVLQVGPRIRKPLRHQHPACHSTTASGPISGKSQADRSDAGG